jgi:hypothetical protein
MKMVIVRTPVIRSAGNAVVWQGMVFILQPPINRYGNRMTKIPAKDMAMLKLILAAGFLKAAVRMPKSAIYSPTPISACPVQWQRMNILAWAAPDSQSLKIYWGPSETSSPESIAKQAVIKRFFISK